MYIFMVDATYKFTPFISDYDYIHWIVHQDVNGFYKPVLQDLAPVYLGFVSEKLLVRSFSKK